MKNNQITNKADIYSDGAVIYNILTHHSLWPQEQNLEEAQKLNLIGDVSHVPEFIRYHSPFACELLIDFAVWLLNKNPRYRPSPREALSHPWIKVDEFMFNAGKAGSLVERWKFWRARSKWWTKRDQRRRDLNLIKQVNSGPAIFNIIRKTVNNSIVQVK